MQLVIHAGLVTCRKPGNPAGIRKLRGGLLVDPSGVARFREALPKSIDGGPAL